MSKQKPADTEDELSVLLSTRNITIAGRGLVIREYTLVDMLQLGDKLDALTHSLAEVMQTPWPLIEEIEAVLRKHAGDIPELIACSVDQPVQWVALLPAGEGQSLIDWWWTQNRRFFYERCRPAGNHQGNTGEIVGFGSIFATLIRAGHDPGRLGTYTLRQLTLYYSEALRQHRQACIDRVFDVNAAFAGGNTATQRVNALKS